MNLAKNKLKIALDNTHFYNARIPIYTNVTAKSVKDKDEIKNLLYEQLTAPVLWVEIINNMINDGVEEFYEVGPGRVLQGLVKRINPEVKTFGIDKFSDVEKYL
jgi:[acyl-carrier-protein] S-malonyltransferase